MSIIAGFIIVTLGNGISVIFMTLGLVIIAIESTVNLRFNSRIMKAQAVIERMKEIVHASLE